MLSMVDIPLMVVAIVVACPLLAGVVSRRRRAALDTALSSASVAAAVAALVHVVRVGPIEVAGGFLVVDRVGAAWAVFAVITALAVRAFAARHLAADPDRTRWSLASGAAASSGIALFWAGNLVALALAAVLTSVAATWLVTARRDTPPVRRSMITTLLGADLLLAVGVAVIVITSRETSFDAAVSGGALHVAAVALVLAALAKCALPPFHGWLTRSLVAPTPTSALLHAGLVNAGGVIAIRTSPVITASSVATIAGVTIATVGITAGLAVMRSRHEVKTSLVWSTVTQMGFMLVQAFVGLSAAAAAHLIAHGAYKSGLFLASGSTLEFRRVRHTVTSWPARIAAGAAAVVIVAAAVAVTGYDVSAHDGASVLIPAFAALTLAAAFGAPGGIRFGPGRRRVAIVVLGGGAVALYLAFIVRFETFLSLTAPAPAAAAVLALGVFAAVLVALPLTGVGTASSARWAAWVESVSRRPALDTALSTPVAPIPRVAPAVRAEVSRPDPLSVPPTTIGA